MTKLVYVVFILLIAVSCHTEQTTPVDIDIVLHIKDDNHTTPMNVAIENRSHSASDFLWTFEGGEPTTSRQKNPGTVIFTTPGEHVITLEAWNDGNKEVKKYIVRVDSAVTAGFKAEVETNNYAPACYNITNLTKGGSKFLWTFEGGEPATYEGKNPPVIVYKNPGIYNINLTVSNGSATFEAAQQITVDQSLDASFQIIPSFEDLDDYEAPMRATFDVKLKGVESILWQCIGATITDPTSEDASIFFPTAGKYIVKLIVSNGKENRTVLQEIIVNPNTNLRTHKDIKFGINTAQNFIAPYYSTKLRQSFSAAQINPDNGRLIDLVFWGLNTKFSYNKFVSPDALSSLSLTDIPNAKPTKFINRQEVGKIFLTPDQFNSMTDDRILNNISISTINYGDEHFTNNALPRVILFETADGRKGAILVKKMVEAGKTNSYIIADIKIQKND